MGGMVDFGFLERAGSLDPVSQAIERMGERMTAERARKAKMAEESRNADRNFTLAEQRTKAITDREDRMQRGQDAQSEVENSKRRSSTDAQIREDIARGDMAAARQRDADYAEVDPSTQTVKHGRGLEIKDRELGPAPEAPVSLPPGAEGPIPTPQIARHAGVIDMAHGQNSPYAEYAGAMDSRDAEAKLGPTVKLGGVTSSVDEIRNSARRQSAADFGQVGETLQSEMRHALESGDPYLREQATRRAERYAQLRTGVEAGTIKPFDAMKQLTAGQELDDKYREGRQHDQTVGNFGLAKQRIANQRPTAAQGTPGTGGALSALSQYAEDNPGDQPGLYRLAEKLGVPASDKVVGKIIQQSKPTEGQAKDAKQSAIARRALDDIDKSGFTPTRDEIQKWLNNQKQVAQAQKAGEGGGIGGFLGGAMGNAAQGMGILAQNETEGLSPEAQDYFANVRRYMETIGRAQSGAAINEGEWRNFFNQYGPSSKGGVAAARKYAEEQSRVSGVAGRQIGSKGGAAHDASSAETKEQRIARLKKLLGGE